MIQVPANAHVFVMHEAVSFRNGIEGTAAIARVVLQKEPMCTGSRRSRRVLSHCPRLSPGVRELLSPVSTA